MYFTIIYKKGNNLHNKITYSRDNVNTFRMKYNFRKFMLNSLKRIKSCITIFN